MRIQHGQAAPHFLFGDFNFHEPQPRGPAILRHIHFQSVQLTRAGAVLIYVADFDARQPLVSKDQMAGRWERAALKKHVAPGKNLAQMHAHRTYGIAEFAKQRLISLSGRVSRNDRHQRAGKSGEQQIGAATTKEQTATLFALRSKLRQREIHELPLGPGGEIKDFLSVHHHACVFRRNQPDSQPSSAVHRSGKAFT